MMQPPVKTSAVRASTYWPVTVSLPPAAIDTVLANPITAANAIAGFMVKTSFHIIGRRQSYVASGFHLRRRLRWTTVALAEVVSRTAEHNWEITTPSPEKFSAYNSRARLSSRERSLDVRPARSPSGFRRTNTRYRRTYRRNWPLRDRARR